MQTIWMGIDPRRDRTRILAMAGPEEILLKANLSPLPSSRSALPALLEAVALWQGRPVRAALVVGEPDGSCRERFAREAIAEVLGPTGNALYSLDYVSALRPPRRDPLGGMGPFADLRQLLLFEAMK